MKCTFFGRLAGERRFRRLSLMAAAVAALIVSLALGLCAAPGRSGPFAYVVTFNNQFGVVDLATGAFHRIAFTSEPQANLVWWDGSLLSLSGSGDLVKVNPATGDTTVIGPTGKDSDAFSLAEVRGKLYLTDFSNNIYSLDPGTGAVQHSFLETKIPPDPALPFTQNTNGTFNLCDQIFYGVGGKLYLTFDSFTVDPNSFVKDTTTSPALYQVDPNNGVATTIAPTDLNLGAAVEVGGKFYAFKWVLTAWTDSGPEVKSQVWLLDLATGKTTPVETAWGPLYIDAAAGGITGAAPASNEIFLSSSSSGQSEERRKWR